jgi:hypothetical protein
MADNKDITTEIAKDMQKRNLYFRIANAVTNLNQWLRAVYNPKMLMDYTNVGTFAKSIKKLTHEIDTYTDQLIDILDKERNNNE